MLFMLFQKLLYCKIVATNLTTEKIKRCTTIANYCSEIML